MWLVCPSGVCWILTLRNSAPSRSPTSTSTLAWYVGNTSKVGRSRVQSSNIAMIHLILLLYGCRQRSEVPRLHAQRAVHPSCLSQSKYAQVLLSARQLRDHRLFLRRHHRKWKTQSILTYNKSKSLKKNQPDRDVGETESPRAYARLTVKLLLVNSGEPFDKL